MMQTINAFYRGARQAERRFVPRQDSTGGKAKLLGIGKRGNRYLRRLFIHGARAVLTQARPNIFQSVGAIGWRHRYEEVVS
jgi:transposase